MSRWHWPCCKLQQGLAQRLLLARALPEAHPAPAAILERTAIDARERRAAAIARQRHCPVGIAVAVCREPVRLPGSKHLDRARDFTQAERLARVAAPVF